MARSTHRDPLCTQDHDQVPWPHICPWCMSLRLARLQGPVKTEQPIHAAVCWCPECMETAVGPT